MASRDEIRALPSPKFTMDDLFHVGTTLDQHGRVTVVFRRGSVVKHVQVRATEFFNDAVGLANAALNRANH